MRETTPSINGGDETGNEIDGDVLTVTRPVAGAPPRASNWGCVDCRRALKPVPKQAEDGDRVVAIC